MRFAVYFTPLQDDPLTLAAGSWLGRDAFTGAAVEPIRESRLAAEELDRLTREPRRYGFHATLVAPFRLRKGATSGDVERTADAFAAGTAPFTIPGLAIAQIGRFFALIPRTSDELSALAAAAVDHFDDLRAPLSDAEIERRRPETLSERQRAYLHRYGYPYVKEEFRFHMTLTGPVEAQAAAHVEAGLHDHFGPLLTRPVEVSTVALFAELEPGADFTVHSLHRLGMPDTRKHA